MTTPNKWGEIREEGEGLSYSLVDGTSHPTWSPVRCGYYRGEPVPTSSLGDGMVRDLFTSMGQETVNIGEDVICAEHLAEYLGTSEDRVQRLGTVRNDFFSVWSVEVLTNEKGHTVTRDDESCKRKWIGACLWNLGEVCLWLQNELTLERLLEGAHVDPDDDTAPTIKVWFP